MSLYNAATKCLKSRSLLLPIGPNPSSCAPSAGCPMSPSSSLSSSRKCPPPRRECASVISYLQQNGDKPVELTVLRSGQELKFSAAPVMTSDGGQKRYRLGFQSEPVTVSKLPFVAALDKSVDQNKKYSLLIVDLVRKMVRREASIKQMEAPIGIARASGEAAS